MLLVLSTGLLLRLDYRRPSTQKRSEAASFKVQAYGSPHRRDADGSKLCWNFWVITSLISSPLSSSKMGGKLDLVMTGNDTRQLDELIELLLLKILQLFLSEEDVGLKDGH